MRQWGGGGALLYTTPYSTAYILQGLTSFLQGLGDNAVSVQCVCARMCVFVCVCICHGCEV